MSFLFISLLFSGKSDDDCDNSDAKIVSSSPKMMLLWKHALESNKAILLDEIDLGPDAILRKVEKLKSIFACHKTLLPCFSYVWWR